MRCQGNQTHCVWTPQHLDFDGYYQEFRPNCLSSVMHKTVLVYNLGDEVDILQMRKCRRFEVKWTQHIPRVRGRSVPSRLHRLMRALPPAAMRLQQWCCHEACWTIAPACAAAKSGYTIIGPPARYMPCLVCVYRSDAATVSSSSSTGSLHSFKPNIRNREQIIRAALVSLVPFNWTSLDSVSNHNVSNKLELYMHRIANVSTAQHLKEFLHGRQYVAIDSLT